MGQSGNGPSLVEGTASEKIDNQGDSDGLNNRMTRGLARAKRGAITALLVAVALAAIFWPFVVLVAAEIGWLAGVGW